MLMGTPNPPVLVPTNMRTYVRIALITSNYTYYFRSEFNHKSKSFAFYQRFLWTQVYYGALFQYFPVPQRYFC